MVDNEIWFLVSNKDLVYMLHIIGVGFEMLKLPRMAKIISVSGIA